MSGTWQDSIRRVLKISGPKLNYGKNHGHGSRQLLQMYYSYDDSKKKRNGAENVVGDAWAGTFVMSHISHVGL